MSLALAGAAALVGPAAAATPPGSGAGCVGAFTSSNAGADVGLQLVVAREARQSAGAFGARVSGSASTDCGTR